MQTENKDYLHENRKLPSISFCRLFNSNAHLLKCEVHLKRTLLRGVEWSHFLCNKKKKKERKEGRRNQESGAKKCPIPSLNSTSCACLCILFVIAGFSWCACGYVSTEWAYCVGTCRVVFILFDFFFLGGRYLWKTTVNVVLQIQWYVMYCIYII